MNCACYLGLPLLANCLEGGLMRSVGQVTTGIEKVLVGKEGLCDQLQVSRTESVVQATKGSGAVLGEGHADLLGWAQGQRGAKREGAHLGQMRNGQVVFAQDGLLEPGADSLEVLFLQDLHRSPL